MSQYFLINILDCLGNPELESLIESLISDFSCPLNAEIEGFLKRNAVDFAQRHSSITYLVLNDAKQLLAYFTLTHKNLFVNAFGLSQTRKRKLRFFATSDGDVDVFHVSAFLIAQLGRNYSPTIKDGIHGDALLQMAMDKLREAQRLVGGGVVFLECENQAKLLAFYQREPNGFFPIGERLSDSDKIHYTQLVHFL